MEKSFYLYMAFEEIRILSMLTTQAISKRWHYCRGVLTKIIFNLSGAMQMMVKRITCAW